MDRLKVLYCSYRDWANEILVGVRNMTRQRFHDSEIEFVHVTKTEELKSVALESFGLLFFVGWSEIIPSSIVNSKYCICLHPSPLPKYRGGSPIQHQIINGDYESAVTLFLMDDGIDTGKILCQVPLRLDGELSDILSSLVSVSCDPIYSIVEKYYTTGILVGCPQDNSKATTFKRRTKVMSEILPDDFTSLTAQQIYDKVRSLQDPYPNAYIRCKGGTILYLIKTKAGIH